MIKKEFPAPNSRDYYVVLRTESSLSSLNHILVLRPNAVDG